MSVSDFLFAMAKTHHLNPTFILMEGNFVIAKICIAVIVSEFETKKSA